MLEDRNMPAAEAGIQVWVLGRRHPRADRSFGWGDALPNLADPHVLVIDLTALDADALRRADRGKMDRVRSSVMEKYLSGGIVVAMTAPYLDVDGGGGRTLSNYHALPVRVVTEQVPAGERIVSHADHAFKAYLVQIKRFLFHFKDNQAVRLPAHAKPARKMGMDDGTDILDGSGHRLGCTLVVVEKRSEGSWRAVQNTGRLVLLPPPTEPAEDAIGRIISVYKGATARGEAPPGWASGITLPGSDVLGKQIGKLKQEARGIRAKIDGLKVEKKSVDSHLRLLYSKGAELEDAVCNALRTLGFDEVRGGRNPGKEDWVLDATTNGYSRAAIEVKGADERTGKHGLLQCSGWVDELFGADGKQTKGVFIPNQHRLEKYPGSRAERMRFEAEVEEHACTRDLCIIPACALFEAVKRALGGEAPDRKAIEARITGTRGVLADIMGGGGD